VNCERCGKRPAEVKFIEVEDGVKSSRWLCEVCAAEEGAQFPAEVNEPISEDLSLFVGDEVSVEPVEPVAETPCPRCGTVFSALEDSGLLGCAHCYESFHGELRSVLTRFHRATTHVGKAPRARGPRAQRRLRVNQLRQQLEVAVGSEDFETAARLRDEIAALQQDSAEVEKGDD